ncbi:hypothetical protein [Bradyrhizobium roseum]|uniref:hypothetical protein n=1 Tax=Bradyrhizobium roseum TaxID=3056648 RepID=UPI002607900E|nr:hypothetical protein [Bradyrhizobium roseus]WKA26416.1 hypothetical protein QUH67_22795 [Bradyrhizobium roseus]
MQANWAPKRALDEVLFVAEAARRAAFPIAIVAYSQQISGPSSMRRPWNQPFAASGCKDGEEWTLEMERKYRP